MTHLEDYIDDTPAKIGLMTYKTPGNLFMF